ncbi:LysM peptidoglycan-binding domain-containing protein [Candidatus Parcubacteria bacterium]|nr:MAG: LysM peptidoglycan-binding domain-containing protein [Candidatus Parcubacteria bacterium]
MIARIGGYATTWVLLAVGLAVVSCHVPFGIYHTVRQGETLTAIADTYGVSAETLKEVNFLRNANSLYPGEQLFIPGADRARFVKKKDADGRTTMKTASLAPLPGDLKDARFIWPVSGVLSSGFGMRNGKMHNGIDISAPIGTPIVAAADGVVIHSDHKQRGFGNLIVIEHIGSWFTVYGHNQVNLVNVGERVNQGQVIAKVGRSGNATGMHLHFEVRQHKKAVDPLAHLP